MLSLLSISLILAVSLSSLFSVLGEHVQTSCCSCRIQVGGGCITLNGMLLSSLLSYDPLFLTLYAIHASLSLPLPSPFRSHAALMSEGPYWRCCAGFTSFLLPTTFSIVYLHRDKSYCYSERNRLPPLLFLYHPYK